MTTFPAAQRHSAPEEIFPDVYLVRGSYQMGPMLSICRNMMVLRSGESLTLVNAIRLTPEGEAALARLGTVRHLVKLGHFHTLDDPYTRDRYSPTFWTARPKDGASQQLVDGEPGPDPRTRAFSFQATSEGEAALILSQPVGNLLLTCDSVQHWPDTSGCSLLGGVTARAMGFLREPAKVGPIWARQLTGGHPEKLRPDFDRLLAHEFSHLVSGHGSVLREVARTSLKDTCDKVLGAG